MLRQHGACLLIDLAECDGLKAARALQAQAEATDAAEQIQDLQHGRTKKTRRELLSAGPSSLVFWEENRRIIPVAP